MISVNVIRHLFDSSGNQTPDLPHMKSVLWQSKIEVGVQRTSDIYTRIILIHYIFAGMYSEHLSSIGQFFIQANVVLI